MSEQELRITINRIVKSLRAIQQDIHAINEQYRAENNKEEPPPHAISQIEVSLPPPVNDYYDSQNREGTSDRRRDRIRLLIEGLTLAAVIIAGFFAYRSFIQVRRQAEAARDQVGIMRKQLEDADRPWISLGASITAPLTYDTKTGAHVTFRFEPKNIGKSPAQNVWIDSTLAFSTMGEDLRETQKRTCSSRASRSKVAPFPPGYILFPGDSYTQDTNLTLPLADIESHWSKFELSQGPIDLIPLGVVGCVDYTFESSQTYHQTGFVFDVVMKDRSLILKSKTPLTADKLLLMRHLFGGYFAN